MTVVPIMVATEMRRGRVIRLSPTGASQTSISLLSSMNFVAGRSGLWPATGT